VVTLTPAGERQLERAARAQHQAEDELFQGLSAAQRNQLRDLLLTISDHRGILAPAACEPPDPHEPA
jgi:DNA-binding MarR family transcriptional regulator